MGFDMDVRPLTLDELCPQCKFGFGRRFRESIDHGLHTVKLRCPDCGREWTMIGSPSAAKPATDLFQR
jgi:rRNA maturation protein Nop10